MGCNESKNFIDGILYDTEDHLFKIEYCNEKENLYVIECLRNLKYLSLDSLLCPKFSFDKKKIEVSCIENIYKSENLRDEISVLLKDLLNTSEAGLLRILKKEAKKLNNIVYEEILIEHKEKNSLMYLNDKMKMLLKRNAEEYYFNIYHNLKEKKKKIINRQILYCESHNRTEFIFCLCKIGSIGLEYLCTKMQSFRYITSLNLQLNKISVDGFMYFTEICPYLPNISELLLDYNEIYPAEFCDLFSCFKFLPELTIFGISENPIGDIGIMSLSNNILFIKNIIYLNIENCDINDISFESLCNNFWFSRELEELDVGFNKISEKGINILIENCNFIPKLKYLWLNDNQIENDKEIEKRIRNIHENKNLKIFLSISNKTPKKYKI